MRVVDSILILILELKDQGHLTQEDVKVLSAELFERVNKEKVVVIKSKEKLFNNDDIPATLRELRKGGNTNG